MFVIAVSRMVLAKSSIMRKSKQFDKSGMESLEEGGIEED